MLVLDLGNDDVIKEEEEEEEEEKKEEEKEEEEDKGWADGAGISPNPFASILYVLCMIE